MQVHHYNSSLPIFNKAVITIGTFDGVHQGHIQILESLKKEADRIGGETVVITFHPHPRKIVSHQPLQLINTLEEKIFLFRQKDVDHLVIVPFNETFANQPASNYVEDFLIRAFHPTAIIIGYDHHFGKDRKGNFRLLEQYARDKAFKLIEIPQHVLENITISSTKIREALLTGELETANDFLGYPYFFEGTVIEGNKLGRTLGYPTANLRIEDADKLIPGNGVYAVDVALESGSRRPESVFADNTPAQCNREWGERKKGMMNIGFRPTVDGSARMIEVNIFEFDEDIYGQTLRVYLKKYIRGEQKFNGLDVLKEQLGKDKIAALENG
jgi:riboflavin kinase / FMN adenylyltransferase